MLPSEVIKAIDADIEKHHKRAGEMLDVVNVILAVASLMLVIYFVPSMCERWLAGMEKEVEKVKADEETNRGQTTVSTFFTALEESIPGRLIERHRRHHG